MAGGVFADLSTPVVVNTVTVNAPSNGFLLVDGYVYVNNEGIVGEYLLSPKLDGNFITPMQWASIEDGFSGGGHFTLNYVVSVPVTAGAHTVTQELSGPSGQSFYNAQHLNTMFSTQGSVTDTGSGSGHGPTRG